MSSNEMTRGQKRRLAKKQAALVEKRNKKIKKCIMIAVPVVIIAVIAVVVLLNANKAANKLTEVTNFSEGLTDEGRIKGIDVASKVTTIDPASISIDYSEIEAEPDEIMDTVDEFLEEYKYFSEDTELEIADGDTINLDYVGSVDGVEFAGGNTNGEGATLVIGSGNYIDDFEEQLIGHKPGEEVTVNVTFPDPYENNADLAGKAAVFECKINSVEVTPELTDEFVAENFDEDENVKTVDEYKAYIKKEIETSNLQSYLQELIISESSASDIPSDYLKVVKNIYYTNDLQNFKYYNDLYTQYYGAAMYGTFNDYTQMTDDQYDEEITVEAKENITAQMAYEVLFDKLGLSITSEDYSDYCELVGEGAETYYGKGYIMMNLIAKKVIDTLGEKAVINY